MQCIACHYVSSDEPVLCPRCGCPNYPLGSSSEDAAFANHLAAKHRTAILHSLDFGFYVYRWKDVDGRVFLSQRFRRSIGTGDCLLNCPTWFPERFARTPGRQELTVELAIYQSESPFYTAKVPIPVPQEPQLLHLGFEIHDDLTLTLFLKNEDRMIQSAPVDFLQK